MMIRIIYESIVFVQKFTALLCPFPKTMIKNHNMFGNTSIMTMVGKVLFLFIYAQQVIKGCYNFRESSITLGHDSHGHVTILQVFEYDMTPLDIL